jgi:hypothetical protein
VSEGLIQWTVAFQALEEESGDLHVVCPFEGGVLVGAIDGLGHGPEAATAAKRAADTLTGHPGEPVTSLMGRCHESLKGTRGAVMTLASLSSAGTMSWTGIGNIEGTLVRSEQHEGRHRESVLLAGGVIGHQLPPVRASEHTIGPGDTLVFTTDGVRAGYLDLLDSYDEPRHVAGQIFEGFGKGTDDALVLVARYLGSDS